MEKYKILFTDHTPFVGGAQLALLRHLRHLSRDRFVPSVVCSDSTPTFVDKLRTTGGTVRVLNFPKLKPFTLQSLFHFLRLTKELIKIIRQEKIDLVVANTERTAYPLILAAKLTRRPFILWVRDFEYGQKLFSFLAFNSFEVVFVSKALKKYYHCKKGQIVYVGTEVPQPITPITPSVTTHYNQLLIGFAGRLVEWKGAQVLVAAGQILKAENFLPGGWQIIIAGSGENQLGSIEADLHQMVEREKLSDVVKFTGFREQMSEFYSTLSIFVHPSIKPEPFATVVVEAMAQGLPVVASNAGGTPEIIKDGENGFLFPSGDASALAEKLKILLLDNDLRKRIGESARETVLSGFTEEKVTKQMEGIYIEVCEKVAMKQPVSLKADETMNQ